MLHFLHWSVFTDAHLGETITHLAELGVLLLLFIAGLDLHLNDLAKSGKSANKPYCQQIFPQRMIRMALDPTQVEFPYLILWAPAVLASIPGQDAARIRLATGAPPAWSKHPTSLPNLRL